MNREQRRILINLKIGTSCVICGRKKNLVCHNTLGENHESLLDCPAEQFLKLVDSGVFVRLCRYHHGLLHSLFRTRIVNTDNLVLLIRVLSKQLKKNCGYETSYREPYKNYPDKIDIFERDIEKV